MRIKVQDSGGYGFGEKIAGVVADMDTVPPYVLVAKKSRGEKSSPLLCEGICSGIIRVDVVLKEGRRFEKGDVFRWELLSEVSEDFCL